MLLILGAARADETAPAPTSASHALEEVVVTAQKRQTNIQDTPLSITAVTGDQLQSAGITDMTTLATQTPGLAVESAGPGQSRYNLNGISSTAGTSPTVGFYLDETPMTPPSDTTVASRVEVDPNLYDVARVEVLRGPQGTLYGAGSEGGTIRIITNPPVFDRFEGSVHSDFSGTEHGGFNFGGDAMVNLPIVDDKVALRVVLSDKEYDGFIDKIALNDFPAPVSPTVRGNVLGAAVNQTDSAVNTEELLALRASLLVQPIDGLKVTFGFYDQRISQGGSNTIDSPPGQLAHYTPFDIPEPNFDRFGLYSITATYDFPWFQVLTTAALLDRSTAQVEDTSEEFNYLFRAPLSPTTIEDSHKDRQFSEETRISSIGDGSLQWVGGVFYQNFQNHDLLDSEVPQYIPIFGTSDVASTYEDQHLKQIAAFGEATYAIIDNLKLTAGLRWYHYNLHDNLQFGPALTAPPPPQSNEYLKAGGGGILPKVTLSYEPEKDLLVYGTYAEGSRVGGGNVSVPVTGPDSCLAALQQLGLTQLPSQYNGDSVDSYELGAKSKSFDGKLTVDGSLFHIDYDKVQQQGRLACGFPFIFNAGNAVSEGGEVELRAQVASELSIGATAAYTHATIQTTIPGIVTAGETLQDVPKWTHTVWAEYDRDVGDGITAFGRISNLYYGTSHDDLPKPSFDIVGLRVGLIRDDIDASVYVDNLTDERAILSNTESAGATIPTVRRVAITRPRTIGLDINYRFGVSSAPPPYQAPIAPATALSVPPPSPKIETQREFQVFFDFDQASLSEAAKRVIREAADAMKAGNIVHVTVTGHTDTVGAASYNQGLSERRAASVETQLVADGIAADEISTAGVGKTGLLVPTADGVREPQNRRAVIDVR
jgi:outer membrane receptor protein involved in Fe transport